MDSDRLTSFEVMPIREHTTLENAAPFLRRIHSWAHTQHLKEDVARFLYDVALDDNTFGLVLSGQDSVTKMPEIVRIRPDASPILVIKQWQDFLTQLNNVETTLTENAGRNHLWYLDKKITPPLLEAANTEYSNIWFNATPSDFTNPPLYLQRLDYSMKDKTFWELRNWQEVRSLSSRPTEKVSVSYREALPVMESPNELHISISEGQPTYKDEIQAVRFGRVSDDTAIVYALQMPDIDGVKEPYIKGLEHQCIKFAESARDCSFLGDQSTQDSWKKTFGIIDEHEQVGNDMVFLDTFFADIKEKMSKLDIDLTKSWKDEAQKKLPALSSAIRSAENAYGTLVKYKEKKKILPKFTERRNSMKQLYKSLKGESVSLMSIAVAAKLFSEKGVRKILVPTYFPLRTHEKFEDGELIDTRIVNNMQIWQRACEMIDGLEIGPPGSKPEDIIELTVSEGGYLPINITKDLSSTHPFIMDLLESH